MAACSLPGVRKGVSLAAVVILLAASEAARGNVSYCGRGAQCQCGSSSSAGSGVVQLAGSSSVFLPVTGSDSLWQATVLNPGATLSYNEAANQLNLNAALTTTGTVSILFNQIVPTSSEFNFGLRFAMNLALANTTGNPWTGADFQLVDLTPGITDQIFFAGGPHPAPPHFHGDFPFTGTTNFSFSPLTLTGPGSPPGESQFSLSLGGPGSVASGSSLTGQGVGIHAWELGGDANLRSFRLDITPSGPVGPTNGVPEPSTFALLGLGAAVVLGAVVSKRRRTV